MVCPECFLDGDDRTEINGARVWYRVMNADFAKLQADTALKTLFEDRVKSVIVAKVSEAVDVTQASRVVLSQGSVIIDFAAWHPEVGGTPDIILSTLDDSKDLLIEEIKASLAAGNAFAEIISGEPNVELRFGPIEVSILKMDRDTNATPFVLEPWMYGAAGAAALAFLGMTWMLLCRSSAIRKADIGSRELEIPKGFSKDTHVGSIVLSSPISFDDEVQPPRHADDYGPPANWARPSVPAEEVSSPARSSGRRGRNRRNQGRKQPGDDDIEAGTYSDASDASSMGDQRSGAEEEERDPRGTRHKGLVRNRPDGGGDDEAEAGERRSNTSSFAGRRSDASDAQDLGSDDDDDDDNERPKPRDGSRRGKHKEIGRRYQRTDRSDRRSRNR